MACDNSVEWGETKGDREGQRERETDRLASGNYTNLCQLSQQKHPMVKGVWQEQVTEGFCLEGVQEPPPQSLSTTVSEFWVVRNTPASWPVPHHIQEGLAVAVRKHNNPNKADLTGRACQLHGQRKMMVDQSPVTLWLWQADGCLLDSCEDMNYLTEKPERVGRCCNTERNYTATQLCVFVFRKFFFYILQLWPY